MKKIFIAFLTLINLFLPILANGAIAASNRAGFILLQVEQNGEAWYVYPANNNRYYLGRPADALMVMKKLGLGATHSFIANTTSFPTRLSGQILLDVEQNGEAYYIYPNDLKKYYLGRPADAFRIMRQLGQGIATAGLASIPIGDINHVQKPTAPTGYILENVPFTSQAPFGQWSDLRQEAGCEEASSLMAITWAHGQSFTSQTALSKILGSSDYTLKNYGEYRDLSTQDTLSWVIKDYFNFQNAALKNNISLAEIITELEKGNVIIAPMNGRALNNPNYTAPGPAHHMLAIIGYDPQNNQFITNDPGTRNGAHYKYNVNVLYNALRDYTTGYNVPDYSTPKNVIVVWK